MNLKDTLWHLDRVANSGILGQPEKLALKQASQLLHELDALRNMPRLTVEEVNAFYDRLDQLLHMACKL